MGQKEHTHRLGSLWVTPETGAALDRLSAETGKSINQIVRAALAAHLRGVERRRRGYGSTGA